MPASVIETIQPPQPLPVLIPRIAVLVLAEEGEMWLPVTYTKPAAVDLVMEAGISGQAPPRVDMKTHLMEDSPEVRGRIEAKQPLKGE